MHLLLMIDYSLEYLGGAQVAFMRQVEALIQNNHRVTVVAPGAKKALKHIHSPNLKPIDADVRFSIPGLDLPVLKGLVKLEEKLMRLCGRESVDGVVIHSEFALAAIALRIGQKTQTPVLQTVHTFFWRGPKVLSPFAWLINVYHTRITGLPKKPAYSGSSKINNALRSMTLRVALKAHGVLSPSKHQARKLEEAGVENLHVFSNVVQDVVEDSSKKMPGEPFKLLWVGRFAPEKNLPLALAGFRLAKQKIDEGRLADHEAGHATIEMHIAGGDMAPEAGVVVHGRVSSEQVAKLMAEASSIVLTSDGFDNQPMAALEAFANKKPVILVDRVLKEEFGDAVFLAGPTAEDLAETIIEVSQNEGMLVVAQTAAEKYARERSATEHVKKLCAIVLDAKRAIKTEHKT